MENRMSHIANPRCAGITHLYRDQKTGALVPAQCRKKAIGVYCPGCDKRVARGGK